MVTSVRRDNTVAIAVFEDRGWRGRCISICADAIRQEMQSHALVLTHLLTGHQQVNPVTKPISSCITSIIFPQWGLVSFTPR